MEKTMAEPKRPEGSKKPSGTKTPTPATNGPESGSSATPLAAAVKTPTGTILPFDLTGKMLGEFQMLRRLGRGGMAEVWLAEQSSLRRNVAVKILRPEFVADATYIKRFRHEATAAGGLNHPNIVQVYMVGEQDGLHYIAQEYVQGKNLKEFMIRKGPMEVPIALHVLRQVANALHVASSSGIVHRDIKPENVMLTKKGEAKVADFGLAQLTLDGEKVNLTQVGVTMGTPLYMSPEQVNGLPLDVRSDIYSLGVMAWHMLTGKPPFMGETAMAIAVKHLNEPAPSLAANRSDLPAGVVALIERMMQKDRKDRPVDALTVANEMKSLLRQATGKEAPPAESYATSSGIGRKKRPFLERPLPQQAGWMVTACVLALASTAGLGWAMRTPDPFQKPAKGTTPVIALPSVASQIYHAQSSPGMSGRGLDYLEAAWQQVKSHPQATDRHKQMADVNLALIYLKQDRQKEAERIFDELSINSDSWSKAHHAAGRVVIAGMLGDHVTMKQYADSVKLLRGPDEAAVRLDPALDQAMKQALEKMSRAAPVTSPP